MIGHTQTHPPGPILCHMFWNRWFGPEDRRGRGRPVPGAARRPGDSAGLHHSQARSREADSAFAAALAWTPLPAVILMLGAFDAVYPLFTLGLLALWTRAAWDGDTCAAAGLARCWRWR
ncbi:MAG: hypothetical protein R2748_19925 [Bryobacterales bacterium]